MTTGENIKIIRKEKGLTQKKLGELCGMSESQIGQYENGIRNPKKETLDKIAKALKVDILCFLDPKDVEFKDNDSMQKEAEDRKIDNIIRMLNKVGCKVVFSCMQDEEIPPGTSALYFNNSTNESVIFYDDELLELEKSVNDFLKFKFNEMAKTKEIHRPLRFNSVNPKIGYHKTVFQRYYNISDDELESEYKKFLKRLELEGKDLNTEIEKMNRL